MSVRIYNLSKQVRLKNNELLEILKERGFNVKNHSSTIDNISAESIIKEFAIDINKDEGDQVKEKKSNIELANSTSMPNLPKGVMVKSKEQVDKERQIQREKIEADKIKSRPLPVNLPKSKNAAILPSLNSFGSAPGTTVKNSPKAPNIPLMPNIDKINKGNSKSPPIPPFPSKSEPISPKIPPLSSASSTFAQPSVKNENTSTDKNQVSVDSSASDIRVLKVKPPIVVRDFATLINIKPFKLISELMELGIFASMNQTIEEHIAEDLASKYGYLLEVKHRGDSQKDSVKKEVKVVDESKLLKPRPPIVCIIGHVDHGKTTLLDTIRKTNVVKGEAGGITQHIGAYQITFNDQKIAFIDTPGHAAFSSMRVRGVNVTDIAILVIAADDGFKPQTEEALKCAQKSGVPIIVAITKTDAKGANIDRTKTQMQEKGIAPEDWGGETITVSVSAIEGKGIDDLLEMILLQTEIMELKANPTTAAEGLVLESQLEVGRGATACLIVQRGTLKSGDALICGTHYCRVRAMIDDQGTRLKSATPGMPVNVTGWSGAPAAGQVFKRLKNERIAKKEAEAELHELKIREAEEKVNNSDGATVDNLFAAMEAVKKQTLYLVIKADVQGSLQAILQNIRDIHSEKVNLNVVSGGIGPINKKDVMLASTAGAGIIGFNVKVENGVQGLSKNQGVIIYLQTIIYELFEVIREAMVDLIEPEIKEIKMGAAEVRQVFPVSKGKIAGSMLIEGIIRRNTRCKVIRGKQVVHQSKIKMLRRFKDDVTEVRAGFECGIQVQGYNDFQEGDIIEVFSVEKIKPEL